MQLYNNLHTDEEEGGERQALPDGR